MSPDYHYPSPGYNTCNPSMWGGVPLPTSPVPKVEIKIETGVRIVGSQNLVIVGNPVPGNPVRQMAGAKRKADVVSLLLLCTFIV